MTTVDGERMIAPSWKAEHESAAIPPPWYVGLNALGGGPLGLQAGVRDWRAYRHYDGQVYRDLYSHGGANNVGLLVKTTGRVTGHGAGFFYLDGDCAFDDGDESIAGVRVDWPFADPMPAEGSFVEVVAVSSCRIVHDQTYGDIVVRQLRPVSGSAVRVLL